MALDAGTPIVPDSVRSLSVGIDRDPDPLSVFEIVRRDVGVCWVDPKKKQIPLADDGRSSSANRAASDCTSVLRSVIVPPSSSNLIRRTHR